MHETLIDSVGPVRLSRRHVRAGPRGALAGPHSVSADLPVHGKAKGIEMSGRHSLIGRVSAIIPEC